MSWGRGGGAAGVLVCACECFPPSPPPPPAPRPQNSETLSYRQSEMPSCFSRYYNPASPPLSPTPSWRNWRPYLQNFSSQNVPGRASFKTLISPQQFFRGKKITLATNLFSPQESSSARDGTLSRNLQGRQARIFSGKRKCVLRLHFENCWGS